MLTIEPEITDDGHRTYNEKRRERILSPMCRPEDRQYSIWSEGYIAQGNSDGAHFHGMSYGRTFKDALQRFAEVNPSFAHYYNAGSRSYWGCKLYADEANARRVYG